MGRQEGLTFLWQSKGMKQLTFITLICLYLSACSLGIAQEFPLPTPVLVVPTAPSVEGGATAVVITPTANMVPSSTTEMAQFNNLYFANAGNGLPQAIFSAGTEQVFAIWDYAHMSNGDVVRRVWTKNDADWLVREEAWDTVQYGQSGTIRDISVYDFEGNGLESGSYQLVLYVNDVYQASALFQIQSERNLATSTETQVAWVQDSHVLMLDAWDGSQRELTQVDETHEIVELLWLPNARHLLFVDQQPSPEGAPWPQHAIWLVDTETAVVQQLSSYDENLHRMALLPEAHYIRTIAGTDFGDACFMDRQLIFMKLDETYQRLTLINLRDLAGELADKPYWFFPEDAGKWVSDHEYEVAVTAYCLSGEMGTSESDLALIGRYHLDLEAKTAVAIDS